MYIAKATTLTILVPVRDGNGVMRFPHSGGPFYGIYKLIDSSQTLADQSRTIVEDFLGQGSLALTAVTAIDPVLKKAGETSSILYILRPDQDLKVDSSWPTIAEILRGLPSGPTRLAYMKALQYLAGAADAEVSVLEVDEEVRVRLKNLAEKPPELDS